MTPEQEEQVRRALAAAAQHDDQVTMPPEVAERLDGVLAELSEARRAEDPPASPDGVVELAHRRPRRRWPTVVAAAAAVAVVALGGGAVVLRSFHGSAQDTTAGAASAPQDDSRRKAESSAGQSGGSAGSGSAQDGTGAFAQGAPTVPQLRAARLRADVQRLLAHRALALAPREASPAPSPTPSASGPSAAATCARPALLPGDRVLAVRLDRQPATLVVRNTQDGTREALVYSCDQADRPVATAPLPAS